MALFLKTKKTTTEKQKKKQKKLWDGQIIPAK